MIKPKKKQTNAELEQVESDDGRGMSEDEVWFAE
jgi:hypothetical protein